MDGRGPQEMRSFALPMTARILALAEYVDTMTNPHSPWATLTMRELIAEISDEDDERFDPKVVAAFLEEHPHMAAPPEDEPVELENFEDIFDSEPNATLADISDLRQEVYSAEDIEDLEELEDIEDLEELEDIEDLDQDS